jgi:hypothetical protein
MDGASRFDRDAQFINMPPQLRGRSSGSGRSTASGSRQRSRRVGEDSYVSGFWERTHIAGQRVISTVPLT